MSELQSQMEELAKSDAKSMLDLSRLGERSAELMLEDVYADLKDKNPGQADSALNQYMKAVNREANKLADKQNLPYNLNFEIVDSNKDGKWNQGEQVKVHNESRYFFRQPAPFNLDGSPDQRANMDQVLTIEAMQKREIER